MPLGERSHWSITWLQSQDEYRQRVATVRWDGAVILVHRVRQRRGQSVLQHCPVTGSDCYSTSQPPLSAYALTVTSHERFAVPRSFCRPEPTVQEQLLWLTDQVACSWNLPLWSAATELMTSLWGQPHRTWLSQRFRTVSRHFTTNCNHTVHCLPIHCSAHLLHYLSWSGARGGAVGWGTALQAGRLRVRFPMVSLESFR